MMFVQYGKKPHVIDQNGKKNIGVFERKRIFEWMLKNDGKELDDSNKKELKDEALPEVNLQTPLSEAMKLLHNKSAIIVKNEEGIFSHLITPRVIANALEDYAGRFMVYEALENLIRQRIVDHKITFNDIDVSSLDKPFPSVPEKMDFGQYSILISKKWNELGLDHLDKKTILSLMGSAQDYRNSLMHFRLEKDDSGLNDAKKLLNLLA